MTIQAQLLHIARNLGRHSAVSDLLQNCFVRSTAAESIRSRLYPVSAVVFRLRIGFGGTDIQMAEYDDTAFNHEQGSRARKLFAAVVLAALDDAIVDHKKYGNGPEVIARWARSRDGREVLTCAGIDPNERVVDGLKAFVSRGIRTSVALSREESERRSQRARAA